MDSLTEGLVPALLGLFNAFLIIGIIVCILYLYRRLVIEKVRPSAVSVAEGKPGEEPKKEELKIAEGPKEVGTAPHEEIAAAVAAVKHHVKLKSLAKPVATIAGPQSFTSAWLTSWLSEITQSWDYNPYAVRERKIQEG
ncbi:MAG: hypothetical protein QXS42_05045 [Zestosphaera sp.]